MDSFGRRWSSRIAALVAVVALTMVLGFLIARPRLEALAISRLQAAASQRGWIASVAGASLTPWLTLDLRGVVLRNQFNWRVEAGEVSIAPRWCWQGLIGRAAFAHLAKASVYLPAGLRMDIRPATWTIDSSKDRLQVALAGGGTPRIALDVTTGREIRIDARFVAAPLSDLVRVLRDGCSLAELGTVDGDGQLVRSRGGLVHVRLKGRARGVALASLSADGPSCPSNPFGTPDNIEAELLASVDPAAGRVDISHLKVRTRGIEASAQAAVTGGTADPHITLDLDVPRMDLAEVLATAGVDLPARDLGVAAFVWHVNGRLLDPESLAVSQQFAFSPPTQPVPTILRLKGDFVHRVETAPLDNARGVPTLRQAQGRPEQGRGTSDTRGTSGATKQIVVSRESADFVPLADVPPLFLKALLLAEDTDFYGHHGVDLRELPLALATNFVRGASVRGASTIPQQLAKNLFLTRRKTVSRKVEEAALALLLDSTLGKSRMLEIYVNVIEWGPGIYGLAPAARHYFGCEPSQLTPRQIAFLVVLIPGPVKYQRSFSTGAPTPSFEGMIVTLLGKLQAVGALSEEEYQAALDAPLDLRIPSMFAPQPESSPGAMKCPGY